MSSVLLPSTQPAPRKSVLSSVSNFVSRVSGGGTDIERGGGGGGSKAEENVDDSIQETLSMLAQNSAGESTSSFSEEGAPSGAMLRDEEFVHNEIVQSTYYRHIKLCRGTDFDQIIGRTKTWALTEWAVVYLRELVATAIFVFAIVHVVTITQLTMDASFGLLSAAFVLGITAYILSLLFSHAHFNPAVTFSILLRNQMNCEPYMRRVWMVILRMGQMVAQMVGGIAGALIASQLSPMRNQLDSDMYQIGQTVPSTTVHMSQWTVIGLEAFGTFVLLTTVRAMQAHLVYEQEEKKMMAKKTKGVLLPDSTHVCANAAVPSALALCVLLLGNLTGASMNPARSLGPAIVANMHGNSRGLDVFSDYLLGAFLAVLIVFLGDMVYLYATRLLLQMRLPGVSIDVIYDVCDVYIRRNDKGELLPSEVSRAKKQKV